MLPKLFALTWPDPKARQNDVYSVHSRPSPPPVRWDQTFKTRSGEPTGTCPSAGPGGTELGTSRPRRFQAPPYGEDGLAGARGSRTGSSTLVHGSARRRGCRRGVGGCPDLCRRRCSPGAVRERRGRRCGGFFGAILTRDSPTKGVTGNLMLMATKSSSS